MGAWPHALLAVARQITASKFFTSMVRLTRDQATERHETGETYLTVSFDAQNETVPIDVLATQEPMMVEDVWRFTDVTVNHADFTHRNPTFVPPLSTAPLPRLPT